jgi:opacity protein-like surface antigen
MRLLLIVSIILTPLALLTILDAEATAFDPDARFAKGTWVASFEGGAGTVANIETKNHPSDIELWYVGARLSVLPFAPLALGPLRGALEIGLEPLYQRYTKPQNAFYAGLALMGRYHFLALGRFVPYIEAAGAAGGTDLTIPEIDSAFAFWVAGGLGASFFVTDTVAVYAGYRIVHVSNGDTSRPNRGFEVSTGVAGVSFFFK